MQALNLLPGGSRFLFGLIIFQSLLTSCSTRLGIPTVSDDPVELFVRREAARIVAVSEDKDHFAEYQIHLSDFPRKDILGMSIGKRRIYISHRLAKFASGSSLHLWLLRQTLAHEIAHETAGHARNNELNWFNRSILGPALSSSDVGLPGNVKFRNYSTEKELEADSIGLEYWKKLGWDCGIWVGLLQSFEKQNYVGDIFHPTGKRLQQAQRACVSEKKAGVI